MKRFEDTKTQLINVHKQLSNLQKVTTTSIERARHVTLLQQLLQGGLSDRLHTVNSDKDTTPQLQVKLPILEMHEAEWDKMVKNELYGQVRFSSTSFNVGSVPVERIAHNAGVRYWGGDFTQVFRKPLKETLKIELPAYSQKVTVYNDKVFAPIRDTKVIEMYNKHGQLQDTMTIKGYPVCIEKSGDGDMLVCCHNTGLFLLKEDSKQLVNIARGTYSDMCMYGDKVYTWDYKSKQIVEFVRENMEWKRQERVVNVEGKGKGSKADTLLVRQCEGENMGVEFFVCLCNQHTILRVSENGEQISQYGDRNGPGEGRLLYPCVCGVDSGGQILVADEQNHKFKLVNTKTGTWMTVFGGESFVFDCKVENAYTVWLMTLCNRKCFITKQEMVR